MLINEMIELMGISLWETIYMVIFSTALSYIIGLPTGVILNITGKDGICPNRWINSVLGVIVNIFRSIPFLILLIWMLPVTQAIVGTMVVNREEFEAISRYYSTIRGREVKYHDDPDLREPIIRRAAPYVEDVYFVRYHKDPLVHNTPDGLPKDRKVATHLRMLQAMADRMIAEAGMYPVVVRIDYNRLVAGSDVPSVFECSPSRNGRDIRCQVMNSEDDFSLMTNDFIVGAVGDRVIIPVTRKPKN